MKSGSLLAEGVFAPKVASSQRFSIKGADSNVEFLHLRIVVRKGCRVSWD